MLQEKWHLTDIEKATNILPRDATDINVNVRGIMYHLYVQTFFGSIVFIKL